MDREDPSSLCLPSMGLRFLITVLMCGSLLPCPTPWKERINQIAQDPAADVTMQLCSPRFSSALRAMSLMVTGRLWRGDAILGAGHLGKIHKLRPNNPAFEGIADTFIISA